MSEVLYSIKAKGLLLNIIYSKMEYGLYSYFSSDERMKEYIKRSPEEAFYEALNIDEQNQYYLNIASTEDFAAFEWKGMSRLLERQLDIFMPIIQKFMIDALTGALSEQERR